MQESKHETKSMSNMSLVAVFSLLPCAARAEEAGNVGQSVVSLDARGCGWKVALGHEGELSGILCGDISTLRRNEVVEKKEL